MLGVGGGEGNLMAKMKHFPADSSFSLGFSEN